MNHKAELVKFVSDWKRYRRMQRALGKLRDAPAGKRDVGKTKATIVNINHHIKTVDDRIDEVIKRLKEERPAPVQPVKQKPYIN